MKNIYYWEPNYFENYIFRNVQAQLPQEFTVEQFMLTFNKIPAIYRETHTYRWRHVLTLNPYHYECNIVSRLLHGVVQKGLLNARYVANNGRTQTIFQKI